MSSALDPPELRHAIFERVLLDLTLREKRERSIGKISMMADIATKERRKISRRRRLADLRRRKNFGSES